MSKIEMTKVHGKYAERRVKFLEEFASDIRIQTEESIIFKNNEIFFLDKNRNVIKTIRGGK